MTATHAVFHCLANLNIKIKAHERSSGASSNKLDLMKGSQLFQLSGTHVRISVLKRTMTATHAVFFFGQP
jgi:hypothetical protein